MEKATIHERRQPFARRRLTTDHLLPNHITTTYCICRKDYAAADLSRKGEYCIGKAALPESFLFVPKAVKCSRCPTNPRTESIPIWPQHDVGRELLCKKGCGHSRAANAISQSGNCCSSSLVCSSPTRVARRHAWGSALYKHTLLLVSPQDIQNE